MLISHLRYGSGIGLASSTIKLRSQSVMLNGQKAIPQAMPFFVVVTAGSVTFFALLTCLSCGRDSGSASPPRKGSLAVDVQGAPRTDLEGLRKLCNLPTSVRSAKWETNGFGRDRGLLAVLTFETDAALDEVVQEAHVSPSSVLILCDRLPQWFEAETNSALFASTSKGMFSTNLPQSDASHFTRSPLLDGFTAIQSARVLILGLYTR